jgi:CubicO group peptidase (beta-lactamase class C family)
VSRRALAALLAVSLAVGLAAVPVLGPRPPSLADTDPSSDTGDAALAARVREVFGDGAGYRGLAVATVDPDGAVRLAGVGDSGDPGRPRVDERTRFEIGSVAKGLTGLLLAEQAARGEVGLDDPVGGAGLEDLATHRSGLPRLPRSAVLASLLLPLTGADPYRGSAEQVLAQAVALEPRRGADPAYSNLGAAAVGAEVARRGGAPYAQLLSERVLDPLGLGSTTVVTGAEGPPGPRAVGSAASGAPRDPWQAEGWAPTGVGVWSTSADLAALVAALAAGTAPGQEAAEPRADYTDGRRIGLFWITSDVDGREVTWHNGGTGGASSFVGFDRGSGRGVVVLANTDADVDAQALQLLLEEAS